MLILCGRRFAKAHRVGPHRWCMGAAVSLSVLFLASYLTYHFGREGIVTRFPGEGAAKAAYFAILFTHTPLAATLLPLLSVALFHAFKGNIEKHRRIVRFVFPIWLYVSVTGVVIYVMLYRIAW